MSFTNLFASLSDGGAKMNDQRSLAVRDDIGKVEKYTTGKKRSSTGEPPGPHGKRQRNWTESSGLGYRPDTCFQGDNSKTFDYHKLITEHENKRAGLTKQEAFNCADKARTSGPKYNQQQRKPTKQWKGQQHEEGRPHNRRGNHQTKVSRNPKGRTLHRNQTRNRIKTQSVKFFSEEFKEKNIVVINEQMVCRHFLHGSCIKGDSCQMQHIEAHNDLIKVHCKYYLQGACMKGEKCPFMHKSFPCKFFHKKGNCSKGEDCRFSHEPLNDVTMKLLNEAMELEIEFAKKNQQSAVPPVTVDETESTQVLNHPEIPQEANKGSDKLVESFKFNFYNSAEPNAFKETCCAAEVEDVTEEEPQPQDTTCQSPPINLCPEPPILYSVEALLGTQSSSVFKNPLNHNPTSSVPANHCQAPYSVDVVLRASKSTDSSTLGHSLTNAAPTPQVISYTSANERCSARQNNKASGLCTQSEANKVSGETWEEKTALHTSESSHCDDTPVPASTLKITQAEKSKEYITGPIRHWTSRHCFRKDEIPHQMADTTPSVDGAQPQKLCNGAFQRLFSTPPHLISPPKQRKTDCNKTLKMQFKDLFVGSVSDQSSTTSSISHHITHSVSAKSADVKCQDSSIRRSAEPCKTHASSLCNLLAPHLSELEAPHAVLSPPCASQPADEAAPLADNALGEAPFPNLVQKAATSTENDGLVDPKHKENQDTPSSPCISATCQKLSFTPLSIDSSSAAASKSVLQTLFLSLSPYQQE